MDHYIELKQLLELVKELGIEDPWVINGLNSLAYRWNSRLYRRIADFCMQKNSQPLLDRTFKIPQGSDIPKVDGPYKVGTIKDTNIEFGFHPLHLQMHGVIGGQSGFGKSTLIKVLAREILSKSDTLIWIIDPKGEGGDFRSLKRDHDSVVILRPDILKCNPFTPISNVPTAFLRESISEVSADSWGLFDASEAVLMKSIHKVLQESETPTTYDFFRSLRNDKVPGLGYKWDSYRGTIETRITKAEISLGEVINCREDYFSKLFDKNVVFEIGELSGSAQRILVPWIIMKLVLYKIKNPTKHLSHLLIFDEAQSNLWSKNLEQRGRASFMASLATQALGILVLAQNPATKLMSEISSNASIKMALQLGSGEEIYGFSRTMGLTQEQMLALYHLDRGEAVCRTSIGYTEPVRLNLYNFEDESLSNDEVARIMKPVWDELLSGIEPAIQETKQLSFLEPARVDKPTKPALAKKVVPDSKDTDLSANEQSYLRIVSTHPWRLLTEIYALQGNDAIMGTETMSQATAVKTRKQLVKKGLLESYEVKGTGKSGRSYFDVPTEKANMGKLDHPRGDLLHSFWCYRVSERFRRDGATVKIGETISGHEVDIGVEIHE